MQQCRRVSRTRFDYRLTKDEARQVISVWVQEFYNERRRHSTIGMTSPVVFEQSLTVKAIAA